MALKDKKNNINTTHDWWPDGEKFFLKHLKTEKQQF